MWFYYSCKTKTTCQCTKPRLHLRITCPVFPPKQVPLWHCPGLSTTQDDVDWFKTQTSQPFFLSAMPQFWLAFPDLSLALTQHCADRSGYASLMCRFNAPDINVIDIWEIPQLCNDCLQKINPNVMFSFLSCNVSVGMASNHGEHAWNNIIRTHHYHTTRPNSPRTSAA